MRVGKNETTELAPGIGVVDERGNVDAVTTGLFDRTVLRPLEWVRDALAAKWAIDASCDDLARMAERGWFPMTGGSAGDTATSFVPLYVPSRVRLLLSCERAGWDADELTATARFEERFIDQTLTAGHLAYERDDRMVLERYARGQVRALQTHLDCDVPSPHGVTLNDAVAKRLRFVDRLVEAVWDDLPRDEAARYHRAAEEVRLLDDVVRVGLLNQLRAQVEAGYSPHVAIGLVQVDARGRFVAEGIRWRTTLAHHDFPIVRLPGVILRDGEIHTTRTLTPREYERLWNRYRLDEYLEQHARLASRAVCGNCYRPMPNVAAPRRRYCSARCQNAASQRRFRLRRPDRVIQIQERYWSTGRPHA